jgi:hypothetical protein
MPYAIHCTLQLTLPCPACHLPAVIPPGHYFAAAGDSSGAVTKCSNGDAANPNGFYQPNWVQYNGVATA